MALVDDSCKVTLMNYNLCYMEKRRESLSDLLIGCVDRVLITVALTMIVIRPHSDERKRKPKAKGL